ncbi:MAG: ATP-grasp domain-containing protein [Methylococcales bacterium]|nr:ATP-grasp domain-containing protein [Methylococcales bacterium]
MLAQAAKNVGLQPLVIDLFADLDTQSYAADFKQLTALTIDCLTPALDYFVNHYGVTQVVYGSGFEQHPDSLRYLQSRFTLLGNSAETFIRLQNPVDFFAVLNQLNIPVPETSFVAPTNTQDWLIKPTRGQGGVGIQRWNTSLGLHADVYWQKYQAGSQHSVLFLADGQQLQVIGFNTQWTAQPSNHSFPRAAWECSDGAPRRMDIICRDNKEFIFAGIMNHCPLATEHKAQITNWLTKLVPAFALTGLNSLDFIHAEGKNYMLEINPRPPASMQCYDADLLRRHIMAANPLKDWQSCLHLPIQSGYTSYQIIYAEQDIQIPDDYLWENGVMDIPAAGVICHTGQPICSIISHHNQAHAVLNELTLKQHTIKRSLYSWNTQPASTNSLNP